MPALVMTGMVCGSAALLLSSGIAKAAAGRQLSQALVELLPALGPAARPLVRGLAVAETMTALSLLVPATRQIGAVCLAVLGVLFGAVGLAGRLRGSALPCGCFGTADSRPFGPRNVVAGLVLLACAATMFLGGPGNTATGFAGLCELTAALVCAGTLAVHRHLVWDAIRPQTALSARPDGVVA